MNSKPLEIGTILIGRYKEGHIVYFLLTKISLDKESVEWTRLNNPGKGEAIWRNAVDISKYKSIGYTIVLPNADFDLKLLNILYDYE